MSKRQKAIAGHRVVAFSVLSRPGLGGSVRPPSRDSGLQTDRDSGIAPAYGSLSEHGRDNFTVSRPGDRFERQADGMAGRVMRRPGRNDQLRSGVNFEERSASKTGVIPQGGRRLDAATQSYMEPRFGFDFSKVRVHTDSQAADSARAVNARAYTLGNDVVFGQGQYSPGTAEGRRLLAHELTHVVQQSGGLASQVQRDGPEDEEPAAVPEAPPVETEEVAATPPTEEAEATATAVAADIKTLDLNDTAEKGALALRVRQPSVTFTSGRRDVAKQASLMAQNISSGGRNWITDTYSNTSTRRALQKWLDDNPKVTDEAGITTGLNGVLDGLTEKQQGYISKHLSGAAFDVQPVTKDAAAIKSDIRALSGLSKFLEKEGGLVRWHAQFKKQDGHTPIRDRYEDQADAVADKVSAGFSAFANHRPATDQDEVQSVFGHDSGAGTAGRFSGLFPPVVQHNFGNGPAGEQIQRSAYTTARQRGQSGNPINVAVQAVRANYSGIGATWLTTDLVAGIIYAEGEINTDVTDLIGDWLGTSGSVGPGQLTSGAIGQVDSSIPQAAHQQFETQHGAAPSTWREKAEHDQWAFFYTAGYLAWCMSEAARLFQAVDGADSHIPLGFAYYQGGFSRIRDLRRRIATEKGIARTDVTWEMVEEAAGRGASRRLSSKERRVFEYAQLGVGAFDFEFQINRALESRSFQITERHVKVFCSADYSNSSRTPAPGDSYHIQLLELRSAQFGDYHHVQLVRHDRIRYLIGQRQVYEWTGLLRGSTYAVKFTNDSPNEIKGSGEVEYLY